MKQFFNENDLDYSVATYNNAIKLLDNYDFSFDLILMDINMPLLDGMSASKKLREIDSEVTLIFITSLAQYAINGYEVNAFDFVLKPISYYNFALKLTRAIDKLSIEDAKTLVINNKNSIKKIKVRNIYYIEVNGTLKTYLDLLKNDSFVLCNQCYFVNLKYVTEVKDNFVHVGNDNLQMSRPKRKDFIHALNLYLSTGGGS